MFDFGDPEREQEIVEMLQRTADIVASQTGSKSNLNVNALVRIARATEEMNSAGPDSNTPLAKLLNEDTLSALFTVIATSMDMSEEAKLRYIVAATIIGMREFEVVYS